MFISMQGLAFRAPILTDSIHGYLYTYAGQVPISMVCQRFLEKERERRENNDIFHSKQSGWLIQPRIPGIA